MKITTNQYARALYEMTANRPEKEVNGLISNFVKILEKNRQTKMLSKIAKRFGKVWDKENKVVEAEGISAHKLDKKMLEKIEKFIKNKYDAKEVVLKNKVDEKIKGGIIMRVEDEIIDGSIIRQLENLKNDLIN